VRAINGATAFSPKGHHVATKRAAGSYGGLLCAVCSGVMVAKLVVRTHATAPQSFVPTCASSVANSRTYSVDAQ